MVGEPGCGKSTFLKSLIDPLEPDTESSLYLGLAKELTVDKDVDEEDINLNQDLQCSFNDLGSFGWLSDQNNIVVSSLCVTVCTTGLISLCAQFNRLHEHE